jgi:hypothetical protein
MRIGGAVAMVLLGAGAALAQIPSPTAVFDNTSGDRNATYRKGALEFGDEITLDTSAYGGNQWLNMTMFEFQYYVPAGFVDQPGITTATFRMYAVDGPYHPPVGGAPGYSEPGTLLFDPVTFQVGDGDAPSGTIYVPEIYLSVNVPKEVVWTVSFQGVGAGYDTLGLSLFDPPTVGTDYKDFWVKEPSGWVLSTFADHSPANFYARVLAVPEPAAMQLLCVAGVAGLGMALIRRRS